MVYIYLYLNHQCFPATRNNHKGQVFITPDAPPVSLQGLSLPSDLTPHNPSKVDIPFPFHRNILSTKTVPPSTNSPSKHSPASSTETPKENPPNAIKNWNKKLAAEFNPPPIMDWLRISQIYTSHFLSPKDYNLHFNHITHRGFVTRIKMGELNITCRLAA
jgi:hypothetical protein